jgi:VWFA-related protein
MRSARLVSGVVAGFLLLVPAVRGQQAPQQAPAPQLTFKARTTIVEVDVTALDRQGNFVAGLTKDDLELYEDGRRQTIEQFYMVSHDRGGQLFPITGDQDVLPEDRARRIFIVLFDEAHLAHDSLLRAKAGAETFVRTNIGPGDFGGVFYNGQMSNGRLTTSPAELVAGIHNVRVGFETRQSLLAPFREFPRIPGEVEAARIASGARELVDYLGGVACREDPVSCQVNGGELQVENLLQQKARLYVRQARILTANTLQNLRYVVNRLARIPGRKTVVFLTEGFYVEESRSDLQDIAAEAARGGTTIYSIDGRGLVGSPSAVPDVLSETRGRSLAFDTGEAAPAILTSATSGLSLRNIDDIGRAFNMVVRDTSTYYVIGYQPDNAIMDGKFRKIEVKSAVSGLNLRARKGYAATALPPMEPVRSGWK